MAFFELLTKNFENRLKGFNNFITKKRQQGFLTKVLVFPFAFFYFLFLSLIHAFITYFLRGKTTTKRLEEDGFFDESDQETLPIVKKRTVKRAADYTTKYLYQTDFGTMDAEEKEAYFKEQLEQSRKDYYEDLWVREMTAGGEGIMGNVLAEISNIPVGDDKPPSKSKETSTEPDKASDIESLREKLLAPKDPGNSGESLILMEPVPSQGGR